MVCAVAGGGTFIFIFGGGGGDGHRRRGYSQRIMVYNNNVYHARAGKKILFIKKILF